MRELVEAADHLALHLRAHERIVDQIAVILRRDVLVRRPPLELVEVRHHENERKLAAVADHHRLRHVLVRLHLILDRLRRDVLPARRDDDVLLAIGDAQQPILERPDVSRVEPAIGVDRLGRRLRMIEVPLHHVRAARENLAVGRDLHLHAGNRRADGTDREPLRRVHRDHRRGLSQSISLEDLESGREEKAVDLGRQRRPTGHEVAKASADRRAHLREHELVRDAMLQREQHPRLPARQHDVRPFLAHRSRPEKDRALRSAGAHRRIRDARVDFLVDARHRDDERRPHLLHVLGNRFHRLDVCDGHARREHQIIEHPLEDVRQREKTQRRIGRPHIEQVDHRGHVRRDVAMRQHRALRLAGSPRRVDDGRDLIRLDRERLRAELRRRIRSHRRGALRLERRDPDLAVLGGALLEHDHVLQRGQIRAHAPDLLRLLVRGYENRHRSGIAEDIGDLLRGERRIDRHVRHSAQEAGVVGDRPLGTILREDRDAVPGGHAERAKAEGDVSHAIGDRAVRDRLIGAADFRQQRIRPIVLLDRFDEQLRERRWMLRHTVLRNLDEHLESQWAAGHRRVVRQKSTRFDDHRVVECMRER